MKRFMQFSIEMFLLLAGSSLLIFSVQPAYGEEEKNQLSEDSGEHIIIRYVNIDSINANYLPYLELAESAAMSLGEQFETYRKNAEELQNRYAKLQDQVNMGTISTDAAIKEEAAINDGIERLKIQEAELAVLETAAMAENDSISRDIALYFDNYSKTNHIDYVLMYGTGMPIVYANDNLDITDEVLVELNAEYLSDNEKSKH